MAIINSIVKPLVYPLARAITDSLGSSPAFSPLSLFGASDVGGWWDLDDDMDTKLQWCIDNPAYTNATFLAQFPNHALFQDSAGTTAVTAVEQSLGMVKDKSGKGNHRTQATTGSMPKWSARKNLLLATATMSTQNVTTVATPYTISHTGTGTITLSGTSTAGPLVGAGSLTFTPTAGTLTMTVSGTVSNAQLEYGSTATPYQRVTTATDYNAIGFPKGCKYDGVDDGMATASINFTATDKMSVCVGVSAITTTGVGVLAELSSDYNSNNAFTLLTPHAASAQTVLFAVHTSAGYTDGRTPALGSNWLGVISAAHDGALATNEIVYVRVSGVAQALTRTNNANTSGNFGNYPLYFGRRGGASLPFNGVEYQTTIINRPLTAPELTQLEKFIATKSGVVLP